jgi:hypothetical protein
LKVYDILGREIITLVKEKLDAGEYSIPFSIERSIENMVASGVLIYRITAVNPESGAEYFSDIKKMLFIK